MNAKRSVTGIGQLALAWIVVALMPSPSFATDVYLVAKTLTKPMPDGAMIPMWGFAQASPGFSNVGTPRVPGPRITVPPGPLTIHLRNELPADPVSIVIPGQIAALNPVRTAPDALGRTRVTSFTHEAAPGGGEAVYTWPNVKPGTYPYFTASHVQIGVPMGLYGPVTIDAAPGQAYSGIPYDNEAILLYSEIDPEMNAAGAAGTFGTPALPSAINYAPTYFLINGQPYPNTAPVVDHPMAPGERVLIRFLNAGLQTHAPALTGLRMDVLAEDGNLLPFPRTDQYSVSLPAGKTIDALLTVPGVGTHATFDRRLALTSAGASPGGMLTHLALGSTLKSFQVPTNDDDGEERASGAVNLSSSDLELTFDKSVQTVAMRFIGVDIPQGVYIQRAYVQFKVDEPASGATTLTIRGEANAAPLTATTWNISTRSTTQAAVRWVPGAWNTTGVAGLDQQTPNIRAVIQEIVNRGDWASGHALAIIITGTSTSKDTSRTAESHNGDAAGAPTLYVEYGLPPGVAAATPSTTTTTTVPTTTTTTGPPGTTTTTTTASTTTTTVPPATSSLAIPVRTSSDDAEEQPGGSMDLTSSDLEMVYEKRLQQVGMRFTGVTIPAGATITHAYVQFHVDETASGSTTLWIQGQAHGNPSTFTSTSGNISGRTPTGTVVEWLPAPWDGNVGDAGVAQQTPEIKTVIQEIVSRGDWAGDALVILITGTSTSKGTSRTAQSYDRDNDPTRSPILHVEYATGATTTTTSTTTTTVASTTTTTAASTTTTTTASTTTTTTGGGFVITMVEDTEVKQKNPNDNFGSDPELAADANSEKYSLIRVNVAGTGGGSVTGSLRLTVSNASSAHSDSGGQVQKISATKCALWSASTLTYNSAQSMGLLDGTPGPAQGPVNQGDLVTFAVQFTGNGDHCWAITSASDDGVKYNSLDAPSNKPVLTVP